MIGALLERHPKFANWLYGFTPPERDTVVLVHRRVYILPTRQGWLFAATLGKPEYPNLVLAAWKGRWKYDAPT